MDLVNKAQKFIILASIGSSLVLTWLFERDLIGRGIEYPFIILTLIIGFPVIHKAILDIISRKMSMELSMTLAFIAAMSIGEYFTAQIMIVFVLIAEYIESLNMRRGKKTITELLEYLPQLVTKVTENGDEEIEMANLRINDRVIVKSNMRIPIDGRVIEGHSIVDQSFITGESLPVEKTKDSKVYAGTLNLSGFIIVETEKIGYDTLFGQIINDIEKANKVKAPIQKIADKLAGYLVYIALFLALITWFFSGDLKTTISVILVAGACGIAAGTPLAITGGIGQTARIGAIVKGGIYIEQLANAKTVVLDKTGTLTLGKPVVSQIVCKDGVSEEELIALANSLERYSDHPFASAIREKAEELDMSPLKITKFHEEPGKGLKATYSGGENEATEIILGSKNWLEMHGIDANGLEITDKSTIYLAQDRKHIGNIILNDVLRQESRNAVDSLHLMGLATVLLTGDQDKIAFQIGAELGIPEIYGEMKPQDKLDLVNSLKEKDLGKVIMVGDGMNDAQALNSADVGISMGSGLNFVKETSDIILIGNDLVVLVELIKISKKVKKTIMQNFYGTLIIDAIGLIYAMMGLLNPISAVAVHVLSEMIFILNSARLVPTESKFKKR